MEESKTNADTEELENPHERNWPDRYKTRNLQEAETYSKNGRNRPKEAEEMLISSLLKIEKSIQKATKRLEKASKRPTHDKEELEQIKTQVTGIRGQLRISRQAFTSTKFPERVHRPEVE